MEFNNIYNFAVFLILLPLLLINCGLINNYCDTGASGYGAIVFTFDDKYIQEWFQANSIFSKYDWKTTFCVTKYGTLSDDEKQKLMTLQNNGHEIASHGNKHLRAAEYLSAHTMEDYINEEILLSLSSMEDEGIDISSFVYPYGSRTVETDLTLFNFKRINRLQFKLILMHLIYFL